MIDFVVGKEAPSNFHFDVVEPAKITLDSWQVDEEYTNIEILVTFNGENITAESYHWKAMHGVYKVDLYPRKEIEF